MIMNKMDVFMFRNWSIKSLLQLWSLATIVAIIVIALVSIYTNKFFSDTQSNLTENVLPMEDASRQINAVSFSFITRQKQVIASTSLEAINDIIPRKHLEGEFSIHWQKMSEAVVDSEQGKKIVNSLHDYYQRFLDIDSQLLMLIRQQHGLRDNLSQQMTKIEELEQKIQSKVEAVAGRINLQVSKNKRAIRLSLEDTSDAQQEKLMEQVIFSDQDSIQKLGQSVRLNALNIGYLTQKLMQSENTDILLSLRDNDIRQHESILKSDITLLKSKLRYDHELLTMTESLEVDILALMKIVIGESSVYHLRIKQLQNDHLLFLGQQHSISILKVMTAKLNQLSSLVSGQSLQTVSQSIVVAERARWIIIILSILITLGMIRFIVSISQRINLPLAELRSAMHALSSEQFDTRLKVTSGKSELAVLATDFNMFAENTQKLIVDLAEAKDSLQIREQHISAILDGVPEAILTLTSDGVIQSMNPAAERVLKANDETIVGLNLTQFFGAKHNVSSLADIQRQLENGKEFDGLNYNKQAFSMWLSLNIISSDHDDIWVCVISDITAWKQAEENLKTTSSELDAILENAMVGIALIKDRVIVRVNNKFEQLFDCDRDYIEGQSTRKLYPSEEIYNQLGVDGYSEMAQGGSYVGEVQLIRQDGSLFWGMMSGKSLNPSKPLEASIWLFEDITQQREKDDKLLRLANLDSLTGLPNRGVFNDRLEHALHKSHRNNTRLAVFFLDLDHFKHINDSLGHKAGDLLLCEVAQRLKSCVREGDTVARLGGDEFTLILEDVHSAQHVAKVADKVIAAVAQSYMLETTEVNVSPSIGISLYPADGRDVDLLLRNADAAMYHAKNNGRNNFQFYSSEMNAQAAKRLAMETSLRRAVEQKELYLNFQPQINIASGTVSGAEALLRWKSEEWGEVSPADFVPILEDTGLIYEVGSFVLEKAIQSYLALKDKLDPNFKIAVNLSGRQFHGGQLATLVRELIIKTGMTAENLELEITETVLMDDKDIAISTLNELSELGLTLAIDDFGTGYSSLSYLKQFPLNVLKIDRSFVRDVNIDADDAAIVDAILAMSRRLHLDVVAEGVETKEQLAFLQKNGCERVQGYFFSKPLDFDSFGTFVEQFNISSY